MHSPHTVRLWSEDTYEPPSKVFLFQLVGSRESSDPLRRAIARARQALLSRQQPNGSFAESRPLDARSLATLVLSTAILESFEPAQFRSYARGLLDLQRTDGSWSAALNGPSDLSATVLAYFALKLSGQSPASEAMTCARRAILSRGGATKIDQPAQVWLAVLGQLPYDAIDSGPSLEKMLLEQSIRYGQQTPDEPPLDTAQLCQAIVAALRPRRHLASGRGIRELFLEAPKRSSSAVAMLSRFCRNRNILPLRRRTIVEARRRLLLQVDSWTVAARRQGDDSSLSSSATIEEGPTPSAVAWTLVALDALGFPADSLPRQNASRMLDSLLNCETDTPLLTAPSRVSADRVIAALLASGLDEDHFGVRRGLLWQRGCRAQSTTEAAHRLMLLNARQQRALYASDVLPPPLQTCEDELSDVSGVELTDPAPDAEILARQLVSAQRADGGWSAALSSRRGAGVPVADSHATALAVAALAPMTSNSDAQALFRAVSWLRRRQQPDGSWPAQGAVGALAITSRVASALFAAGGNENDDAVSAAADWLMAHQQADGGWGDAEPGETDALAGEGFSNVRDTAAALLVLLTVGQSGSEAVARGVEYLVSTQSRCGNWRSTQDANSNENALDDLADALLALGQYAASPRDRLTSQRAMVRVVG